MCITACCGCVHARELVQALLGKSISAVGQFLSQHNPNCQGEFLTWFRSMNNVLSVGQRCVEAHVQPSNIEPGPTSCSV